jgi:LuxR family transcriptional regulator, activator of conjugal transfer of Ti plasmids
MHDRLRMFCDFIESSSSQRMLKAVIHAFAKENGFEYFAYVEIAGNDYYTIVTNYEKEWLKIYIVRNYREIDPVVIAARRHMQVFAWSLDDMRRGMPDVVREFRDLAVDHGLRCGITIPVVGAFGSIALLTFASSTPVSNLSRKWDPQLAAHAVHGIRYMLKSFGDVEKPTCGRALSARERACLNWQAKGKTIHETADLLRMSPRTAQHHLDRVRVKLEAVTIPQAIAIAKDLDII